MTDGDGTADGETVDAPPRERSSDDPDERSAPLADLARDVRERRAKRRERSDATASEDPFEQIDVDDVDRDRLWEELSGETGPVHGVERDDAGDVGRNGVIDAADSGGGAPTESTTDGVTSQSMDATSGGREDVVPKREFCERCPHFGAPPEAVCGHEGTDIVEVVTFDQFRVRNCPKVDD